MPEQQTVPLVIAIVGAGPRGTGVLERLIARAARDEPDRRIDIHVIDPYPPGAGRIWRQDQPSLLWMNSTTADVTMFTDDTTLVDGPLRPGPTLAEWVAENATTLAEVPGLTEEVRTFTPGTFASRSLQSRYLRWVFDRAVAEAPDTVRIRLHTASAVDLRHGGNHGQIVELDTGEEIDAHAVLLAQGHPDCRYSPTELALESFAAQHGVVYIGPGYTADLDADLVPPRARALVSGLGLAFIDWIVLLAESRGGRFVRDGDEVLTYEPSGREPVLYAGSRRGVPYHSKISYSIAQARPPLPRFFTPEAFPGEGPLDFRAQIWPLASKELAGAHYHELFARHSDRTQGSWEEFDAEFSALPWDSPEVGQLVENFVPKEEDRIDLVRLNAPLAGEIYSGLDEVQERITDHIEADIARRGDPYYSPDAAVFSALLSVYATVGELIRRGRIPAESIARDVEGWLHSLFSFFASGPPPQRLEQLLALNRAGIVRFLGPDVHFTTEIDPHTGSGRFLARSDAHPDVVTAETFIEARLPVASISNSGDTLLRTLHERGDIIEIRSSADSPAKLGVDGRSRILDSRNQAQPRRFGVGPWVSGHNWSSAFPRPRTNAGFFRHNDALAADLLASAATPAARITP